jgi:nucleoside phosphorylase
MFMSFLDDYSINNSIKNMRELSSAQIVAIRGIVSLFDDSSRANVADVHASVFGLIQNEASANRALNRLLTEFNICADKNGIAIKMQITAGKKGGSRNRWIWFSGASSGVSHITGDLDRAVPYYSQQAELDPYAPKIIILTFNEIEFEQVLKLFTERPAVFPGDNITGYDLGMYGHYKAVAVRVPEQGELGAYAAAERAWSSWAPAAIFIVGIGYGAKPDDGQECGDVLVSGEVQDCNRVRKELGSPETLNRGSRVYNASRSLYQKAYDLDTAYAKVKKAAGWPNVHFGKLLSKDALINDLSYLTELISRVDRGAVGGEMEGAGLGDFAYRCGEKFKWIIIKGISDFADGNKGVSKKKRQTLASKNAAIVAKALIESLPPPDDEPAAEAKQFTGLPSGETKDYDNVKQLIDLYGRDISMMQPNAAVDAWEAGAAPGRRNARYSGSHGQASGPGCRARWSGGRRPRR